MFCSSLDVDYFSKIVYNLHKSRSFGEMLLHFFQRGHVILKFMIDLTSRHMTVFISETCDVLSFRETCSWSKKRKTKREILSEKRIQEEYQKLGAIR